MRALLRCWTLTAPCESVVTAHHALLRCWTRTAPGDSTATSSAPPCASWCAHPGIDPGFTGTALRKKDEVAEFTPARGGERRRGALQRSRNGAAFADSDKTRRVLHGHGLVSRVFGCHGFASRLWKRCRRVPLGYPVGGRRWRLSHPGSAATLDAPTGIPVSEVCPAIRQACLPGHPPSLSSLSARHTPSAIRQASTPSEHGLRGGGGTPLSTVCNASLRCAPLARGATDPRPYPRSSDSNALASLPLRHTTD